jgi:hypothetical protein
MKKFLIIASLVLVLCASAAVWYFTCRKPPGTSVASDSPPKAFDGTSDKLKETLIVSTLDEPMPPGKNVIWCASFQMAWNKLKDNVVKEPILLQGAQQASDRLNKAPPVEADLPEGSWYAAAGLVKDGIIEKIKREMNEKFQRTPDFSDAGPDTVAAAYAFLQANVKFTIPFFENRKPFLFKDAAGNETAVGSFGVRQEDDYAYRNLRKQVEVLYFEVNKEEIQDEFVIDPCCDSSPCQIVLACVPPKGTLEETLKYIEGKIPKEGYSEYRRHLIDVDVLLMPNIFYKISHHFRELESKPIGNRNLAGLVIDPALQDIEFKLDRSGVELASEAKILVKPSARYFIFDRPFLIYIRQRGAPRPFFVMWVSNAELLCKK